MAYRSDTYRRREPSGEDEIEHVEDESEHSVCPLSRYSFGDDLHRMNINKKKGWVLLIKNTEFDERSLPEGNAIDTLKDLFEEYNYNVRVEREVTATDMLRSVQHYAKKAESNCFLCFISSHGDLSSLECVKKTRRSTEKISVELEDLYEAANTEELKGCPKMFFIDACREDAPDVFLQSPTPPDDDFLIGLSCLAKKSSRAEDYYLHHIGKIFKESFPLRKVGSKYSRDIKYLMEKVNRDVQVYAESQGYSQKPVLHCTLRQQLFLQ